MVGPPPSGGWFTRFQILAEQALATGTAMPGDDHCRGQGAGAEARCAPSGRTTARRGGLLSWGSGDRLAVSTCRGGGPQAVFRSATTLSGDGVAVQHVGGRSAHVEEVVDTEQQQDTSFRMWNWLLPRSPPGGSGHPAIPLR